ncbi:MAG: hypothetical protein AB1758_05445 [Candidatus Eremiobacterota bacterium]
MIERLWIGEVANPLDGNVDVLVTLSDGRGYAFTAFTPGNVARVMAQEGLGHFVCDDLLLVRDLNEPTIRAAVEDVVANYDLDRHGIRQG